MSNPRKPEQTEDDPWAEFLVEPVEEKTNSSTGSGKPTVRVTGGPREPPKMPAMPSFTPPPVVEPTTPVGEYDRSYVMPVGPGDGRVDYSCLYPMGAGVALGSVGGGILNAVSRLPKAKGALQGAAFMAVSPRHVASCMLQARCIVLILSVLSLASLADERRHELHAVENDELLDVRFQLSPCHFDGRSRIHGQQAERPSKQRMADGDDSWVR
jgi:hypothetical protein